VVFGNDTFWVVGYCLPAPGLVVYSETPASLTISGNMLVQNVIRTSDQQAEGWPGTFAGMAKEGLDPTAVIRLDGLGPFLAETDFLGNPDFLNVGGVAASGSYTIPASDIVDVGYVAECPINITWTATGVPVGSSFLAVQDFLGQPDFLGAASSQFISVRPYIQIDPGTGTFGGWQAFVPGVYLGRRFNFQLIATTLDGQTIAYALGFQFEVTVPGRIDHYQNQSIAGGGATITFKPDGAASAAPFNGGPNGQATPYVLVTGPLQTGDTYTLTETLSSLTIQFFDKNGAAVARSGINIYVEGY
jgi:hypothetical protein